MYKQTLFPVRISRMFLKSELTLKFLEIFIKEVFCVFFPPSALCLSMSLASSEEIHGRNWQVEKWSCSEALLHFLWVNNKKEFNAKDFVICDATSRCHFWYSTLIKAKKNLLDTVDIHWEKRFLGRSWLSTKNEKNDRIFLFL